MGNLDTYSPGDSASKMDASTIANVSAYTSAGANANAGADKKPIERDIPFTHTFGADVDSDSYEDEGMRVDKVSILVDYSVISPDEYGIEEEFTVEDFISWGKQAVFDVIDFHGGLNPAIEYDETLELYRVSYTQDPKYAYEDASAMIEDPDDDGNYPIIKGESCGCNCMSIRPYRGCKCECHDEGYEDTQRCYLVRGELRKITLTYHA